MLCLTLCDPLDCSTPGFPVLHYLPEFPQTNVHWVDDAIQPSHPLSTLLLLPSINFILYTTQKIISEYRFGDYHQQDKGFPDSSVGKESTCNAGDPSSIPGSDRSTGEGIGYPLQYSWASLVAQLVRNCLQCRRFGFNSWVGKIPWRREWLPTPVFWPGEFHGLYSPWSHKGLDTTERLSLSLSGLSWWLRQ